MRDGGSIIIHSSTIYRSYQTGSGIVVLKNRDSIVDRADRFKNLLCYQTPEHCWYGATMRPVEGLAGRF